MTGSGRFSRQADAIGHGTPVRVTGTQRETIGMLIHELTIAIQRERERQLHATLTTRRHLALPGLGAPRGVLARLRAIGRPATPTVPTAGHARSSRIDPRSI